eukprot:7390754-Prymnesium_polylepis.1
MSTHDVTCSAIDNATARKQHIGVVVCVNSGHPFTSVTLVEGQVGHRRNAGDGVETASSLRSAQLDPSTGHDDPTAPLCRGDGSLR